MNDLWQDLRYGVRLLRKHPGFTAVAVLTLALGIGANTEVFSVVEAELWKPLPFPDAERVVGVFGVNLKRPSQEGSVSVPDFLDLRSQNHVFDDLAAFRWSESHNLTADEMPERVTATAVSSNFFETLQISPALGRVFDATEERIGQHQVAMLSHAIWQKHFNADPNLIGQTIALDGAPYTVIGIAPAELRLEFMSDPDLYVPITFDSTESTMRSERTLNAIARLKPGVSVADAKADLVTIAQRLAEQYPKANEDRGVQVKNLREAYTGYAWRALFFFMGAAGLILLIACANIANLLLSRALTRQREFAIRAALGASRNAVIRQLLVESVLLALPGGALGILLAAWGTSVFSALAPSDYLSRASQIELDARVFVFAVVVSLATAILFGLVPAVFASRVDLNAALKQGSRSLSGNPGHRRARKILVVAEVALAFALLFGAGLFVNSYVRLRQSPLGFDPSDLLTMRISLRGQQYSGPQPVALFYQHLLERVRAVPGVRAATITSSVPLRGGEWTNFALADGPQPVPGEEKRALIRITASEYFSLLKTRVLAGRSFSDQDSEGAAPVALINENLARHFFPGENPIGKELVILPGGTKVAGPGRVQIVGLVENTKEVGMNEVAFDSICLPFSQHPAQAMTLVVNTAVPDASIADSIRREVVALDKDQPVYSLATMDARLADSLKSDKFNMILIGAFAGLATLLAAVGIYGAMSYAVEQRTQEFGIRMALGAGRAGIFKLALTQSATLGLIGLGFGLAVSLVLARLFGTAFYLVQGQHEGLIYGVSVYDPLTLTIACALLIGVTLLASYIPSRRATHVDPLVAVREE